MSERVAASGWCGHPRGRKKRTETLPAEWGARMGVEQLLLVQSWSIPAGQRNEASTRESSPCTQVKGIG